MAELTPFQQTITDGSGNVVPNAKLRVQKEVAGLPFAQIYDGPNGDMIANPATADENGFVVVYVEAGTYRFTPLSADETSEIGEPWKNVPKGDAQGYSADELRSGINLNVVGEFDPVAEYSAGEDVSVSGLQFRSLIDENIGNVPQSDPPQSNEFWHYIAVVSATVGESQSNLTIGTGNKTIVTQSNLSFTVGTQLRVASSLTPSNWMNGIVVGYSGSTLVVDVTETNGSGTFSSWTISVTGERGPAGVDLGLRFGYQDTIVEGSGPPSGTIWFDNLDISAATKMYVSHENAQSDDFSARFADVATWGAPGFLGSVSIVSLDGAGFIALDISAVTVNASYSTFSISHRGGINALLASADISVQLNPAGPQGAAGLAGGLTGAQSTSAVSRTVSVADKGDLIVAVGQAAAITFTFDAAASLSNQFLAYFKNEGSFPLTLAPLGGEQIDGLGSLGLAEGEACLVWCDGTKLRTGGVMSPASSSSASVPVGASMWWNANTPPTGWLEENGAEVSRTTYANLFAVIGETFGAGDGVTTFNLPDVRGEFVRGWDNGRGVDAGRSFGTAQADEFKSHSHEVQSDVTSNTSANGSSNRVIKVGEGQNDQQGNTQSSGGSETRPRNVAKMSIIKF